MTKTILVTGAAGYIGSHTCVALLSDGFRLVGVDNFCNSNPQVLRRIEQISGKNFEFIQIDIRDAGAMQSVFEQYSIDAVLHFAGLKAVGESVEKPLIYFDNNVGGTVTLLKAMLQANVRCLVFSSSATVYGDPMSVPIVETAQLSVTNPYGRSKLIVEQILADLESSDNAWRFALLRYFNPVGAHPSGLIGEDPKGTPSNLMPYIAQVAAGLRPKVTVFGDDYPTADGTGVRDYIHVVDLAQGHLAALKHLLDNDAGFTVNLGTGQGHSVFEVIKEFEKASGQPVPYQVASRRNGDIAVCYADTTHARRLLGWEAKLALPEMCADYWRWQINCSSSSVAPQRSD